MMTDVTWQTWPGRVDAWFRGLPGSDGTNDLDETWQRFSGQPLPVVTVFGSYDTGKSSLLRRILVDAGDTVPDWLAISAKPETEKTSEVEVLGCLFRDTPGITSRPDPLRGTVHNLESFTAIRVTDFAVVLVNPQLATEEVESLRAVIDQRWPEGSLILVVGRFDEAGPSPEDDPVAYQDLSRRKENELRTSLRLPAHTPVRVVSQDPFGIAGDLRQPDPSMWDDFRAWDGMDALEQLLRGIGQTDLGPFRAAAQLRYWLAAIREARQELQEQLVQHKAALALASQVRKRRESWLGQLAAIDQSAQADAQGLIETAVYDALAAQSDDPEAIKGNVQEALNLWWRRHTSQLQDLLRGVDATMQRQHERPAWKFLENLAKHVAPRPGAAEPPDTEQFAQRVTGIARNLLNAARKYRQEAQKTAKDFAAGARGGDGSKADNTTHGKGKPAGRGVDVDWDAAFEAAPLLMDTIGQFAQFWAEAQQRRAVESARLEQAAWIEREANRLALRAVAEVQPEWQALVSGSRRAIESQTDDAVAQEEAMERLVPQVEAAVRDADRLLADAEQARGD